MATTDQATLDLLATDGYDTTLIHVGALFDDTKAGRFMPDGHVRHVRIDSIGKTVTGWQVRVSAYHGLPPADFLEANHGVIHLDTLLADYQPILEI